MRPEEDSKPPEAQFSVDVARKLNLLLSETDDESESVPHDQLFIKEEKIEETMQELYQVITSSACNSSTPPPSSPSPSSSSSSVSSSWYSPFSLSWLPLLAVSDVQSESCGASISDSTSTVMAGIEVVGSSGGKVGLPEMRSGWPENELKGVDSEGLGGGGMYGFDAGEVGDEQWLMRVLEWGPLLLEEWT